MATVSVEAPVNGEASKSAIAWGPIFAGAFAAVVATAVLMGRIFHSRSCGPSRR